MNRPILHDGSLMFGTPHFNVRIPLTRSHIACFVGFRFGSGVPFPNMGMGQNPVPLVNIPKMNIIVFIGMFTYPILMVIGINPWPYWNSHLCFPRKKTSLSAGLENTWPCGQTRGQGTGNMCRKPWFSAHSTCVLPEMFSGNY